MMTSKIEHDLKPVKRERRLRGTSVAKLRTAREAGWRAANRVRRVAARIIVYSATTSPEPPNSAGKSFSFGKPSRIGNTVSA
jgi:hypothetical protein